MSAERELRLWLNRTETDVITNIKFGIEVWHSIEFVSITKYEIITEEFCKNLPKLKKAFKKTPNEYENAWSTINEFLELKCSPGAISITAKELLVETLLAEAKKTRKNPLKCIFDGLQLLLHSSSMQNYYKSEVEKYAAFIGDIFKYQIALISKSKDDALISYCQESTSKILTEITAFTKSTPFLSVFCNGFTQHTLVPFTELIIMLQHHSPELICGWREILKDILFHDNQTEKFKSYFQTVDENSIFHKLFSGPHYTFLMVTDMILMTCKGDADILALFLNYLFEKYFHIDNGIFSNSKELLDAVTYSIYLLNVHGIQLSFEINGVKSLIFVGKYIQNIFDQFNASDFYAAMRLIYETLLLNPMLLEHNIISIVVRCMFAPKDTLAMTIFEELLCLTIDVFKRLGRPEKFISQLMKSITDVLSTMKLSKKLKRKVVTSDIEESSKKIMKDSEGYINGKTTEDEPIESYIDLILANGLKTEFTRHNSPPLIEPWPSIEFAWPVMVGDTFAKFVSGLLSKPSLTVWKTLIFTLSDLIATLKEGKSDENTLFKIEYVSALLTQYFDGCRLAEQSDQMWDLIENNRQLTRTALKEFGIAILNQEHNSRTMNSFLKICLHSGNFDILSLYYCPDSLYTEPLDNEEKRAAIDVLKLSDGIHSYLLPQEWTLIEQRITNFGKDECRNNITKLYLQEQKSAMLFTKTNIKNRHHLLSSTLSDLTQVSKILTDQSMALWFVTLLNRSELIELAEVIFTSNEAENLLKHCHEHREFMEIVILSIFKQLQQQFKTKKSILNGIDFTKVFEFDETIANEMVQKIRNHITSEVVIRKYSDDSIRKYFGLLNKFAFKFLSQDVKNIVFILTVSLYWDVKSTKSNELLKMCSSLVKELLHFGDSPEISKYLTIADLQQIFSVDEISIFKLIFKNMVNNLNAKNVEMFENLLAKFQNTTDSNETITICIALMEQLVKEKKCKEHFVQYKNVLLEKINNYFLCEHQEEELKIFANRTLSGFTTILGTISFKQNESIIDHLLKSTCQMYLHNAIDYNNSSSLKLLNLAVINKDALDIPTDLIKTIIDECWQKYLDDLNANNIINSDCSESLLKLIFAHKTNEELVDLFAQLLAKEASCVRENLIQYKLFGTMGKLLISKMKGNILIEAFKQFSFRQIMTITESEDKSQFTELLNCQQLILSNTHLPVSMEFIDNILTTLSELNIKKYEMNDQNSNIFVSMHGLMSDVCYALIQHRANFIVDRIPQFVSIIKDLIQSICFYKSNRKKDINLETAEVSMIAELAHKIEKIIKSLIKYEKDVRRVAPYLLIFIFNLVTSNERPTTLYPKVKTPIESICYDLISVCDHRVEGFVMRNCNEAMKPVYEELIRDFNKYHKFKGKI